MALRTLADRAPFAPADTPRGRTRRAAAPLALGALFCILRLPSLLEPTWYSDEGTYADIGRALLNGAVLYRDVWDNKPPGMYWLAAAVMAIAGPRGPAFPIVAAVVVAAASFGVWRLGMRFGGRSVAIVATSVAIVLMSLPDLEGDLVNAEIVGAALVVWAMVLTTNTASPERPEARPRPSRRALVGAGALVGAAVMFKGVFAIDVLAVGAVPVWWQLSQGRRPGGAWREVGAVLVGVAATVGAVVALLAVHGSVSGLVDVLFRQDTNYVQLTTGPAGAVARTGGGRSLEDLLLVARMLLPMAGVALVAVWRAVHRDQWGAAVAWWLGCDVAGAMVSDRGFSHYAAQSEAALALAVALVATRLWRRRRAWRVAAAVAVCAAWPAAQLVVFLPGAEVALAHGRRLPKLETGSFRTTQLPAYYRLSWDRVLGARSAAYDALFPVDLRRQRAVVTALQRYSRPSDAVFVWGTVHWAYALADRDPAGRYVSLNTAYAVDPDGQAILIRELSAGPPVVLIADQPLPPAVLALVRQLHYARLAGAADGADVWLAPAAQRRSAPAPRSTPTGAPTTGTGPGAPTGAG